MRYSLRATRSPIRRISGLTLLPSVLFANSLWGQDVGKQDNEYLGNGSVITVVVHDPSGERFSSSAVVKLFYGITPIGQRDTTRGVAEFVVTRFGDFSVVVSASGYPETQETVAVQFAGRTQVDVYLREPSTAAGPRGVPGRPLLAPKAKEALDKGFWALKENKLGEAEKYLREAVRLAPGNPDVLYIRGLQHPKQQQWKQAQIVLEKAAQLDPNSARTFAALGMALCDEGNFEAAIAPLRKSLQLDPTGRWETQWALAKSFYHLQQYDEALKLSQASLEKSAGGAPEIALLVAQSLTAVGRYENAAQILREFLKDHENRPEAVTAQRWLGQLEANGKIRSH